MEAWSAFFASCIHAPVDIPQFTRIAAKLSRRSPLPAIAIANLLYRPTDNSCFSLSTQSTVYTYSLLKLDLLDIPSILRALYNYSSFRNAETSGEDKDSPLLSRWKKSYSHEEVLMYGLSKMVTAGSRPKTRGESLGAIKALVDWLKLLTMAQAGDDMLQSVGAESESHNQETTAVKLSVGALLVAVSDTVMVNEVLKKMCHKNLLKEYSESLVSFLPILNLSNGGQVYAERLQQYYSQTLMPLQPVNKKASAEINKIIDSTMEPNNINNINVPDMPVMNSKAGLYIHLNSLLVGRPMVDDSQLLSILHNRYQGDIQTTCIDLIVSSFDVLANAIFRNEKQPTTFVLRSFLINKVPLLVSTLFQTGFVATTAETCITEALSRIDTNAFPTFSSMFDDNGGDNMFADSVRQDFCFACCLHDLIAPESIERLLGEIPMQSLPTGGRYTKDVILHGCLANQDRIASFIEELENMDGNVGAVAVAITGVVQSLCESKDTGSLKTLCAHLARKPSALDAILLFERPVSILQPICRLLDEWRYDDDQSEYQPVYDEFGSIVLLVLVFVHRYDLNASDLGLTSASSFIQSLLNRSGMNQTLDQLTPEQSSQIGTWINALFSSSGTGLGDEPMAQCPPQSFYHLIPTLIHHIIMAFDHGRLSLETMKNGLEYLVDTFLLPSLVPALHWLANHIWAQKGDATACMAFLSIVMLPTSISSEASQMLSSILPLVATPLDSALRALQRKEPARTDIEPLLQILKPYLLWTRNGCVAHTEMESWCNAAHKGLMGSLTRLVRGLMSWSLNASGEGSMPTLYTHAQILFTVKMRGAKEVLDKILTTVAKETAAGNGSVAIDVATWLVMAPTQGGDTAEDKEQTQITLKEAMMFEVQDIGKLMKQDQAKAEALVRVYRRVQVLSTRNSSDQPMMGLQSGMDTGQLPQIMAMGSDLNMMGGLGDDGMMLDTSFVDAF